MQCTAKSKRSKRQCGKSAMRGKRVCHMHGGRSKAGFASATFRTGKRSRYVGALAPILGERYLEAMKDPNQLSLSPDIALLDARVKILLKRAQGGESAAGWRRAQGAFESFVEAQTKKDREGVVTALSNLSEILRRGAESEAAWDQIGELAWKKRPRLVEAETRRQVAQAELVHLSTVIRLLETLAVAVKAHIKDPETLSAISQAMQRIAGAHGFAPDPDVASEAVEEDGAVH